MDSDTYEATLERELARKEEDRRQAERARDSGYATVKAEAMAADLPLLLEGRSPAEATFTEEEMEEEEDVDISEALIAPALALLPEEQQVGCSSLPLAAARAGRAGWGGRRRLRAAPVNACLVYAASCSACKCLSCLCTF